MNYQQSGAAGSRAAEAAQAQADVAKAAAQAAEAVARNALFRQLAEQEAALASSPSANYEATRAARRELENQLDNLKSERFSIAQRLRDNGPGAPTGADLKGLEARMVALDARIAAMDKQIEAADAAIAKAAAVPGAIVEQPRPIETGPPEEVFVLSGMFIVVVLLPLTIAYARRIWRRSAASLVIKPQELYERFTRLEQSIDAVAIEVERVGESQRFLTRVQSQLQERAQGAGPSERLESGLREREPIGRKL